MGNALASGFLLVRYWSVCVTALSVLLLRDLVARSAGHACHWSSCFACCPLACHRHKYFLVYVHVSRTSFYRIQQLMSSRQTHSPPRRLNGNHHLYRPSHSNSHPPPPPPTSHSHPPKKRNSPSMFHGLPAGTGNGADFANKYWALACRLVALSTRPWNFGSNFLLHWFAPPLQGGRGAGRREERGGGGAAVILSVSTPVNSPLIRDGGVNFGDNSPEKDNAQAAWLNLGWRDFRGHCAARRQLWGPALPWGAGLL